MASRRVDPIRSFFEEFAVNLGRREYSVRVLGVSSSRAEPMEGDTSKCYVTFETPTDDWRLGVLPLCVSSFVRSRSTVSQISQEGRVTIRSTTTSPLWGRERKEVILWGLLPSRNRKYRRLCWVATHTPFK